MTQTTPNIPATDIINHCSTIISVSNIKLVQDIYACDSGEELRRYTNVGHQDYSYTTTMAVLPLKFFYNKNFLANILVERKFRITINTYLEPAINVHLIYITIIIFKQ